MSSLEQSICLLSSCMQAREHQPYENVSRLEKDSGAVVACAVLETTPLEPFV